MKEKILIVGAGLCGTLMAIRMAQRGYRVELREKRPDMRLEEIPAGRSINLALSNRGLKALRLVGMDEQIKKMCIPMYGRMIHPLGGTPWLSEYSGRAGDFINSVSRPGLNMALLNKAEEYDNLEIKFHSECTRVDLENAIGFFKNKNDATEEVKADIIIGADGAGSAVRRSLMARSSDLLFNFSQQFLRHGYKELSIPPAEGGGWRIEKNALHIWPRGGYMTIALPNLDGSFTVTVFHPFEGEAGFKKLTDPETLFYFFEKEYPDLLQHIPNFIDEFYSNPTGTLGIIKCYPWQAFGKTLITGDAAHAIVPFYGQGMNAAFEDVSVFDQILNDHNGDWEKTFSAFQDCRVENTNAIADLAVDNFYEMRDHVDNPVFIAKRNLERKLEQTFPDYYSKYSLVTFNENMPYREAMLKGRKQDELLKEICQRPGYEKISLEEIYREIKSQVKY
ncbi:MAG TPA: FAD-dependent monooxygenase [Bacteroidetes bacterium]|nr:FAD-dependent monooxygenase [Bacteroidota bacterium]